MNPWLERYRQLKANVRKSDDCLHGDNGLIREGDRRLCGLCLGMPLDRIDAVRAAQATTAGAQERSGIDPMDAPACDTSGASFIEP